MKGAGKPQDSGCSILLQFTSSLENKGSIYWKATTRVAWATLFTKVYPRFTTELKHYQVPIPFMRPGQKNTPRYPFVAFAFERIPKCCLFYLNI